MAVQAGLDRQRHFAWDEPLFDLYDPTDPCLCVLSRFSRRLPAICNENGLREISYYNGQTCCNGQ